ncbi:uncharacterized protein LOC116145785 [Pistacia vera]|uniref:uncharacterized protein LOC116145785 n=1 Tax=Pistacia vera TaxID=55513 RepID=UPI0012633721|nr:uncharacterized protein LOC116145785 [Pistacia vera]
MVTSWILNSNSKEIVEAFLYTTSARELWKELEERFGERNGPLLYQIQREISSLAQGNMPVVQYYTKFKKLWDELTCLMAIPQCSCGVAKSVAGITSFNRLMQFLMGLNDSFDHIKNQILVMDPLPTVNKAYSMILRVKKQREVHVVFAKHLENSALFAKAKNFKKEAIVKNGYRRKDMVKKSKRHCEFCNNGGHTKETCFKLHGYLDWYKESKEQKGKSQPKNYANMTNTPLERENEQKSNGIECSATLSELI